MSSQQLIPWSGEFSWIDMSWVAVGNEMNHSDRSVDQRQMLGNKAAGGDAYGQRSRGVLPRMR
jgi:hypothetical protein